MYHYLKWAALSYFLKRNLRYLALIGISLLGIYVADSVYKDLADYATRTDATDKIAYYLAAKWVAVLLLGGLILFSIFRLGLGGAKEEKKGWKLFAKESKSARPEKKKAKEKPARPKSEADPDPDPVMERLEKFRHAKPLRRKADVVIGKKRKTK